ncbi:GNAT family N-acetyltransferase [Peribacillus simplex]|uniref:GNAT family N-acetyltransferase n=1 Tax=Peribacillus simplex NBRC 15720 = DSM 1321 TaxID=1349754 RepID=A0A223EPD2_9BACI|nr:GNAT family N-acetyltransferase [Peribacillus simplex]ASS97107.1 GNAT family N-acetyltransferase [Peribacillus simplex NBRC 15720 = DSM 1321]MEC1398546.1 GNAT family N-acetyltransferase [Peribacillus simplex]
MVKIRKALLYEVEMIREQRVKAYEEHAQSIPEGHWDALKKAISSDADEQRDVELLVAELDGEVVGSVALFPAKSDAYKGLVDMLDYPEIRMLAVTPQARHKGVAEALIQECIRRTKVNGSQYIGLHTADFMKTAMRLYERMGFVRLPQFDFQPADDGIIVKAYRLSIE